MAIAVWGIDVFVVGDEYTPINSCPSCAAGAESNSELWKNDHILVKANAGQGFTAIALSNDGVFLAGMDGARACLFKNGVAYDLTGADTESVAAAIAVWGNDVYVTGYENISGHNLPVYWKNGDAVLLTNDTNNNAYSTDIFLAKQ